MVVKSQGNNGVVRLPKGADQKECKSDQYGSFVIQFHIFSFSA